MAGVRRIKVNNPPINTFLHWRKTVFWHRHQTTWLLSSWHLHAAQGRGRGKKCRKEIARPQGTGISSATSWTGQRWYPLNCVKVRRRMEMPPWCSSSDTKRRPKFTFSRSQSPLEQLLGHNCGTLPHLIPSCSLRCCALLGDVLKEKDVDKHRVKPKVSAA